MICLEDRNLLFNYFSFFFLQFGIYSFLQIFKIAEERPLKRKVPPLPDFSYFDGKQTEQNEKS